MSTTESAMEDLSFTPKMFDHAKACYDAMLERSKDISGQKLWEGAATMLLVELGMPNSYYSNTIGFLKKAGCIELNRRGGGVGSPSLWLLNYPPTISMWIDINRKGGAGPEQEKVDKQVAEISKIVSEFRDIKIESVLIKQMVAKLIDETKELKSRIEVLENGEL